MLESCTSYYVTVFHDRFREEYNSIDVRHILVQPAAGTIASGEEGYEEEQEQLNAEAKTIADERAVVQKESAAIRASFREESHDSGVRCVPNTHSSRGILAHRTPGETMSPSSCIYSPWARGHILARSNV